MFEQRSHPVRFVGIWGLRSLLKRQTVTQSQSLQEARTSGERRQWMCPP